VSGSVLTCRCSICNQGILSYSGVFVSEKDG
jgi:hypothetical protein